MAADNASGDGQVNESDRDLVGDPDGRCGRRLWRIQVLDDGDQRESGEAGEEHRADRHHVSCDGCPH